MTLPANPPRYDTWADMLAPIREGEAPGWRTFALQRALITLGYGHRVGAADGAFGPKTAGGLRAYQRKRGLHPDGIAGPATQAALLADIGHVVSTKRPGIPDGLLAGFANFEGVNILAATNWYTPPGGTPGVDCGPVQWRQTGPPFDAAGLRHAFNAYRSFQWASELLARRARAYRKENPSLSNRRSIELAVLAHNWPVGAESIVKTGHTPNPSAAAVWTTKPGGGHYTQAQWADVYVNRITSFVTW